MLTRTQAHEIASATRILTGTYEEKKRGPDFEYSFYLQALFFSQVRNAMCELQEEMEYKRKSAYSLLVVGTSQNALR